MPDKLVAFILVLRLKRTGERDKESQCEPYWGTRMAFSMVLIYKLKAHIILRHLEEFVACLTICASFKSSFCNDPSRGQLYTASDSNISLFENISRP